MTTQTQTDVDVFLNDLLEAMGFADSPEDQKEKLKETLREGADWEIERAIAENADPQMMDAIEREYPEETDGEMLLTQLITRSPKLQEAILKALEEYTQEVLQT